MTYEVVKGWKGQRVYVMCVVEHGTSNVLFQASATGATAAARAECKAWIEANPPIPDPTRS